MTTQRNAGPNRMRLWADYIEQNVKHHLLPLAVKNPDTLRELAAQWEADLSARDHAVDLAGINAEAANELERRAERAEAALERARALVAELEWCGVDNWLECPWCLGTKAEHYGEPAGHKPDCKLAALLSATSGGAA